MRTTIFWRPIGSWDSRLKPTYW